MARQHEPPEAWCDHCVRGKGKESQHKRVVDRGEVAVVQVDYQFWSAKGTEQESETGKAGTSITVADTTTGALWSSMVIKKGRWKYAEASIAKWISSLGHPKVVLQGDSENSLLALLAGVAAKATPGLVSKPRASPPYSKASNGQAERGNQLIAARVRTMLDVIRVRANLEITAASYVFAWAVRHAAWVYTRLAQRRDGKTPYENVFGNKYCSVMVAFGELVHVKL